MSSMCYIGWMVTEDRNRLRAEAGLPLLNVQAEERQIVAATEQAAFEREWQRRRLEFANQWVERPGGWVTKMGLYALARQKVRREMNAAYRRPDDVGR